MKSVKWKTLTFSLFIFSPHDYNRWDEQCVIFLACCLEINLQEGLGPLDNGSSQNPILFWSAGGSINSIKGCLGCYCPPFVQLFCSLMRWFYIWSLRKSASMRTEQLPDEPTTYCLQSREPTHAGLFMPIWIFYFHVENLLKCNQTLNYLNEELAYHGQMWEPTTFNLYQHQKGLCFNMSSL